MGYVVCQLIIIGNGFDRQCKLKSSYANFYQFQYKSKIEKIISHIGQNYYMSDLYSADSSMHLNVWDFILVYYFVHKNSSLDEQWASIEEIIELVVDDKVIQCIFGVANENHKFSFFRI